MQDFKAQRLKAVLKELLKKKSMTYEDLAGEMDCSVPTIKRILGPEELTLNRLLRLCEILEVGLADLEAMANESKEEVEYFTDEQQEFLAKNRHFFAYLMRLFEGESPKQIAEKFNLSQRSTDKYLIGLERYGLIRVSGKQKVKPAFKNVPSLGRGPLGRAHFEALIRNSATFFVENVKEAMALGHLPAEERRSVSFSTLGARLTRATFKEWEDEQEKLRQIYLRRAEYEEKTKPRGDLMHLVVTQAYTLLPLEHPSLKILDESFGPITNF